MHLQYLYIAINYKSLFFRLPIPVAFLCVMLAVPFLSLLHEDLSVGDDTSIPCPLGISCPAFGYRADFIRLASAWTLPSLEGG